MKLFFLITDRWLVRHLTLMPHHKPYGIRPALPFVRICKN